MPCLLDCVHVTSYCGSSLCFLHKASCMHLVSPGDQYYMYEFLHQPSHEECIDMSAISPSTMFRRYTDVYYNNYEPIFRQLFSNCELCYNGCHASSGCRSRCCHVFILICFEPSSVPQHHSNHHFIDKDWKGLKSPVDAVMTGRMYVPPWTAGRSNFQRNQQWGQQQGQQWNQQYGQQWGRRRQSRSPFWGSMAEHGMNMGQEFAERGMEMGLRLAERRMEMEERLGRDWSRQWDQDWNQDRRRDGYRQNNRGNYDYRNNRRDGRSYLDVNQRGLPVQSVYFFKGGNIHYGKS